MSLSVKAHLVKNAKVEIRRLSMPAGASTDLNYSSLVQKLSETFPSLRGRSFATYWKDADGDMVTFSSDDELKVALAFEGGVLKVFIEVIGDERSSAAEAAGASAGNKEATAALEGSKLHHASGYSTIHPDLEDRVYSALNEMKAMGFHDNDEVLSEVLRNNGCDVSNACTRCSAR